VLEAGVAREVGADDPAARPAVDRLGEAEDVRRLGADHRAGRLRALLPEHQRVAVPLVRRVEEVVRHHLEVHPRRSSSPVGARIPPGGPQGPRVEKSVARTLGLSPASVDACFFDVDGEPLLDRLQELCAGSVQRGPPIRFQ
jgi:hypothetical protein